MKLKEWINQAVDQLKDNNHSAYLDAELLLMDILQKDHAYVLAHPERELTPIEEEQLTQFLDRRKASEPIAYILQHKEFWSMDLIVTKEVLIPRPETELLVEITLATLPKVGEINILDLGTGSGAIALALAKERPHWNIIATDISNGALNIAKKNAERHKIFNVHFIQSDWFENLTHYTFHAMVSNPPYIAEGDPHLMQGDVRFEPRNVLLGGLTGLSAIQKIIYQSHHYLVSKGYLIFEHGYQQGETIMKMMQDAGFQHVKDYQDLAGLDRIMIGNFDN